MWGAIQGRRRKVGCVTLVMACVSLAGWFRSQTTSDSLTFFSSTHRRDSLISGSSRLGWQRVDPPPHIAASPPMQFTIGWSSLALGPTSGTQIVLGPPQNEFNWNFCGVAHSETTVMGARFTYSSVSYWYLIIPLMGLAAWLLLHNTRPTSAIDSRPQQNASNPCNSAGMNPARSAAASCQDQSVA